MAKALEIVLEIAARKGVRINVDGSGAWSRLFFQVIQARPLGSCGSGMRILRAQRELCIELPG